MKRDLDRYMQEADVDGLIVLGPSNHNPAMAYFTGPVHVGSGILALPRNAPGVLYAVDMEREEVGRTGYRFGLLDWPAFTKEADGDPQEVMAVALEHILRETNMAGRILVAGLVDAGEVLTDFRRLERRLPGLKLVDLDRATSPLQRARSTKDAAEIERIRHMGEITTEVVGRVAEWLTSQRASHGVLVDGAGRLLTIGDVKQRINLWLMELGAEDPEGTIFAIGRDGGIPHSVGAPESPISVGQPIVFDLFPCEIGGGYFYDFTRTWCIGHAPEPVAAAHAEVVAAYHDALARTRAGTSGREVQRAVCEFFEARGHPTVLTDPHTREGYVHSIAHGLGLEVHEHPNFRLYWPPDILEVGHVVTIEPGLYYPDRGFGVRVEDTVWISPDGPRVLVPYPMDLVLPLRRSRRGPAKSTLRKGAAGKKKAKPRSVRRTGRAQSPRRS